MTAEREVIGYVLRRAACAVLCSFAIVAASSAFNLSNGLPKPAMPASASGKIATDSRQLRTLTFADRVAYQRAIEEVYWHHRIWPRSRGENAKPKPPLYELISRAEIEKKVEDYLLNSQALEDYWQKPITPDQLQDEMNRMARDTKQPAMLREIFAALGNDSFVIAECLARPVLTERLITQLYDHDQRFHGELKRRAEAELQMHSRVSQMKKASGNYIELELIKSDADETAPAAAGVSPAPDTEIAKMSSSEWHESVEKLASDFGSGAGRHQTALESADMSALSKNVATGQYEALPVGKISPLQEDQGHYYAVAVMKKDKDRLKLATVAWLKEPLQSWLAKAETRAPVTLAAVSSANYELPAIASDLPEACAIPWTQTSTTGAPDGRQYHTAVWTGSEMIVWGGQGVSGVLRTGGRYNPTTDSWNPTSTMNAPTGRHNHTAVWTGSEMIVWGGNNGFNGTLNTGGRYNPINDSWTATSTIAAPVHRYYHTAVWTGSQMIVWGGWNGSSEDNTGGKYDPATDIWTATSTINAPARRDAHKAVWTGTEMIVWGGWNSTSYFRSGGRYNPGTDSWAGISTTQAPVGRILHTAVWTGSQMIVWGGYNGPALNTGGRYDPTTDSWTASSTINAPDARENHTAVWTGSQMIVWGGFNGVIGSFNTGSKYNPASDTWAPTSTMNAPSARASHTAVWTGSEMTVWGGLSSNNGRLKTGGRYCPSAPNPQILYDQYNNTGTSVTVSAKFTDSPSHNSDLADDFVVPGGQTWNVQSIDAEGRYFNGSGPATDWNVLFYTDNAGFPGTQIYSALHKPSVHSGTTFTVNLATPAVLTAGRYWVEIQANMTFSTEGEWGWTNRHVISNNAAAWRNPGGGFGMCPSWGRRGVSCNLDPSEPDQVFRLKGTMGGSTPTPTPSGTPSALGNISTRAFVQTGDNAMIGGFIIHGTTQKKVVIRAIGPELIQYGVPHALANPTLELHDSTGALIASNNNWTTTIIGGIITANQVHDIQTSGHAPNDGRESAIIAELPAGDYTAIVRGLNGSTGVALVEVYDLAANTTSSLHNISTRSFVQREDNVMIGGFIVQGSAARRVIIRAIGPELSQYGVPNPLANPRLELHNAGGALIGSNDDWQHTIIGGVISRDQVADIQNSNHAPADAFESAIVADLQPGSYTAIVRGVNNTIGVALVEVYELDR